MAPSGGARRILHTAGNRTRVKAEHGSLRPLDRTEGCGVTSGCLDAVVGVRDAGELRCAASPKRNRAS